MHLDSKLKSAFISQSVEYKRMPYGLMNAPVAFQMVMTQVLRGQTWRQCLIYLDDKISVHSSYIISPKI